MRPTQLDKPLTIWSAQTKGLILKTPHSHRDQLTPLGRRVAVLFTKTYGRVLAPGLILLDPKLPDYLKQRNPLGHGLATA